jgi:hypothetical protein
MEALRDTGAWYVQAQAGGYLKRKCELALDAWTKKAGQVARVLGTGKLINSLKIVDPEIKLN